MPSGIVVKVGASKRVPQSRIWIEGRRLISAGFVRGARYDVLWTAAGASLTLSPAGGARKVAGTSDRPIIDITGASVRSLQSDSATVTFSDKKITIEGIK